MSCSLQRAFKVIAVASLLAFQVILAATPATAPSSHTTFLASLTPIKVDCWTDTAGRMVFHQGEQDWNHTPITIAGTRSPNGLFTHPPPSGVASVSYALGGTYQRFDCAVGITDDHDPQPQGSVVFLVIGDGKTLWTSPFIARKGLLEKCSVNVAGVQQLQLQAKVGGSNYFAHAAWLEPQLADDLAVPVPTFSGAPQTNLTDSTPRTKSGNVNSQSPPNIAARRQAMVDTLDAKIATLRKSLVADEVKSSEARKSAPDDRREILAQQQASHRAFVEKQIQSVEIQRSQAAALSDAEIQRQIFADSKFVPRGELIHDQHRPGPVSTYPNWHGPWQKCPTCNGTGFSDASRQQTQQNIDPDLAAVVGTGMTRRIQNAIAYCEDCGGTGQVPDLSR